MWGGECCLDWELFKYDLTAAVEHPHLIGPGELGLLALPGPGRPHQTGEVGLALGLAATVGMESGQLLVHRQAVLALQTHIVLNSCAQQLAIGLKY